MMLWTQHLHAVQNSKSKNMNFRINKFIYYLAVLTAEYLATEKTP